MPIQDEVIAGMFSPVDGFHHPRWAQIIEWIRNNVAQPNADTWNDIVRIWLGALEVLSDVALGLMDPHTTRGKPKRLAVIIGDGCDASTNPTAQM